MEPKHIADVPFNFGVDFKSAAGDNLAVELASGDLLIEGFGANYAIDREDEAFKDGAFSKAIDTFLAGNAPLCYHHKYDTVIGKVVSAEQIAGKGVLLRAIVDHQPENSPYRHIYEGIKKGRINGLSCGGIFKRETTDEGTYITDVDLLEWSATPVAVGRGTSFSVVAGKAVEAPAEAPEAISTDSEETPPAELVVEAPVVEPVVEEPVIEEPAPEDPPTLDGLVGPDNLMDRSITGEKIAPGSIEAEHFSDKLRSSFSELKVDEEERSMDDLSESLGSLGDRLEQVAERIGLTFKEPKKEGEGPDGTIHV